MHSKEESLQEESVKATKIVSSKCANSSSVELLIRHFVKIYNGSEGKLTVLSQKYSVLKAIGLLSSNNISDKQAVFNLAIDELVQILKQETTEASVVVIFAQIKLWINKSGQQLNGTFWKYVKEFRKSKIATSLTITALYECLNCYISSYCKFQAQCFDDDLVNALINSARNMTSSIAKILVLNESLYSSMILLNLYKLDNNLGMITYRRFVNYCGLIFYLNFIAGSKFKIFLQYFNQLDKVTLLTDKFIHETSTENLICLSEFIFLSIKLGLSPDEINRKYVLFM